MPVLIGILMLMGIVTKNAILLVDFAIEMIHQGMEAQPSHGRSRSQARPSDHHDLDRHVGRHAAIGAWASAKAAPSARPWQLP